MYDLHTHTILSDGELLPSELATRYEDKGFKAIAITDHADFSNLKSVCGQIAEFCAKWPRNRIKVIPGVELTHLPLEQFSEAVAVARAQGVRWIVAHGQTLVEPVVPGTARAAIVSQVNMVSHPGLIAAEDVRLAAEKKVFLEISSRKGHCLGNGHVVNLARQAGCALCVNSDAHSPSDIPSPDFLRAVALAAGMRDEELRLIYQRLEAVVAEL